MKLSKQALQATIEPTSLFFIAYKNDFAFTEKPTLIKLPG